MGGLALAGSGRAVLRWSGAKSTAGGDPSKSLARYRNAREAAVDRPRQLGGVRRSGRLRSAGHQRHGRRVLRVARARDRQPGARARLRHRPGRHTHRAAGVRRDRPGRRPRHAATGTQQGRRSAHTLGRGRRARLRPRRGRFRLIFLTGNSFQAFATNADQEALLGRVRAHLHDEGLFAFETRNPRWHTREDRDEDRDGLFVDLETRAEEEARPSFTDAEGREVRESRTRTYDHVAQVLHWTTYRRWHEGSEERTKITRIALRYTFPQELAALLHYNG